LAVITGRSPPDSTLFPYTTLFRSDVMALAHIAQNTNSKFVTFLTTMETSEVDDFWRDILKRYYRGAPSWVTMRTESSLNSEDRARLTAIRSKYINLRNVSYRMTSAYDFRRIFNVHSAEGRRALDLIKNTDFLPRLAGRTP